jgi:hypothetical protein
MYHFEECTRGDTWEAELPITLASGSLTGCRITMTIKRRFSDADAAAVCQIDNGTIGGITIVQPLAPIAIIGATLTDEQTAAFPAKSLVADVQLELPDGTVRTVKGLDPTFPVRADVTRRTTATP